MCVCVHACILVGVLQHFHTYMCVSVCVEGWRVTAIIISVTHHCWGKERGEEELHSHAVEREGVKTKKGLLDELIQLKCTSVERR